MMTIMMPAEPEFQRILTVGRPLVPLPVAAFLLNQELGEVLEEIEAGKLEYAWDLHGTDGARRGEVRIYWRCLLARLREERIVFQDSEVYADIIPSAWQTFRAASLHRRWACSQSLITRLIKTRSFACITHSTRGQNGSPEVTRASVVQFLQSRRMYAEDTSYARRSKSSMN